MFRTTPRCAPSWCGRTPQIIQRRVAGGIEHHGGRRDSRSIGSREPTGSGWCSASLLRRFAWCSFSALPTPPLSRPLRFASARYRAHNAASPSSNLQLPFSPSQSSLSPLIGLRCVAILRRPFETVRCRSSRGFLECRDSSAVGFSRPLESRRTCLCEVIKKQADRTFHRTRNTWLLFRKKCGGPVRVDGESWSAVLRLAPERRRRRKYLTQTLSLTRTLPAVRPALPRRWPPLDLFSHRKAQAETPISWADSASPGEGSGALARPTRY